MVYQINWDLLGKPVNVGEEVWKGYHEGVQMGEKRALKKALGAYADDPNNAEARRTIYSLNPQLGAALEDQTFEQSERRRAADFRGAYGEHLIERSRGQRGPVNSLSGVSGPPSVGQPSAFGVAPQVAPQPAPPPGIGSPNAFLGAMPSASPAGLTARPTAENVAFPAPGGQPMPSNPEMPGVPSSFERMVRADPAQFLTYEGKRLDIDEARLKQLREVNNMQMQLLGGVHDDASLRAAKDSARRLASQFGLPSDSVDAVPDTYTPELVRSLQMMGMDTAKQLVAVARENKLDWDIEDDQEDNERADREAGSRIEYREGTLANQRERTRIAREKPTRPAARGPAAKAPTKTGVIGRLIDKQARGQKLTPAEQSVLDTHGGTKGGETYPEGTVIEFQDGSTKVRRNGKWVKE